MIDPIALGQCRTCRAELCHVPGHRNSLGYLTCPNAHGRLLLPGIAIATPVHRAGYGTWFRLAGGYGIAYATSREPKPHDHILAAKISRMRAYALGATTAFVLPTLGRIYRCPARLVYAGPNDRCQRCQAICLTAPVRRKAPANAKPRLLCPACREHMRGQYVYATEPLRCKPIRESVPQSS